MSTRIRSALACLLVAGICLLTTHTASASELLDRMLNLGGSAGCGCSAKGGSTQKGVCATQKAGGKIGGKYGSSAVQNKGAAQCGCATGKGGGACQKGSSCGKGAAQHGGKGCSSKGGVAQHGKGGCGCQCSTPVLDRLRDITASAKCRVRHSMDSLECSLKTQVDRLYLGRCNCGGKSSGKSGKAAPSFYHDAPIEQGDQSPAYDSSPRGVVPPPAPLLDPTA